MHTHAIKKKHVLSCTAHSVYIAFHSTNRKNIRPSVHPSIHKCMHSYATKQYNMSLPITRMPYACCCVPIPIHPASQGTCCTHDMLNISKYVCMCIKGIRCTTCTTCLAHHTLLHCFGSNHMVDLLHWSIEHRIFKLPFLDIYKETNLDKWDTHFHTNMHTYLHLYIEPQMHVRAYTCTGAHAKGPYLIASENTCLLNPVDLYSMFFYTYTPPSTLNSAKNYWRTRDQGEEYARTWWHNTDTGWQDTRLRHWTSKDIHNTDTHTHIHTHTHMHWLHNINDSTRYETLHVFVQNDDTPKEQMQQEDQHIALLSLTYFVD